MFDTDMFNLIQILHHVYRFWNIKCYCINMYLFLLCVYVKNKVRSGMVVHTYNPSYVGGRDWRTMM
jgi:hypothetical protein